MVSIFDKWVFVDGGPRDGQRVRRGDLLEGEASWEGGHITQPGTLGRVGEVGAGMATGAWDAAVQGFTAPGRAARGDEVTLEDAWMTAGMMPFGAGLAGARPSMRPDPNRTGMFVGERMASDEALDLLPNARILSAKKRSPSEIWRATGWAKGADGGWRTEIPDSSAALVPGKAGVREPLGYQLIHDELFAANPTLADYLKITADSDGFHTPQNMNGAYGSFDPLTADVKYSSHTPGADGGPLGVVLHEVQHYAQGREGFAKGSAPAHMAKPVQHARRVLNDLYGNARDQKASGALSQAEYRALLNDVGDLDAGLRGEPRDVIHRYYTTAAGEVEADDVMARRNMTHRQRRDTLPKSVTENMLQRSDLESMIEFHERRVPGLVSRLRSAMDTGLITNDTVREYLSFMK